MENVINVNHDSVLGTDTVEIRSSEKYKEEQGGVDITS